VLRGVPMRERLAHVARLFNAVEVNGSHYRQIARASYAAWAAQTPPGFRFAVKGHRFVTHYRRLSDCGDSVRRLREQASGLGDKLAVVVWQLPATFARDVTRLDDFLGVLGSWGDVRHALELRHASWFTDDVRERLRAARVASCLSDAPDFPLWPVVTTDLVYVRLHGHTRKYASSYAPASLARWAARARAWAREGRDVHIYLDNDAEGAAIPNAETLTRLLGLGGALNRRSPTRSSGARARGRTRPGRARASRAARRAGGARTRRPSRRSRGRPARSPASRCRGARRAPPP
jgi:uncharacterized protein YecE (DUF72 family)